MAVIAQSGTPLDVSHTHDLPEIYPDWLPVDTRLTPLGNHVRLMTHLHGAFVAADSDGNPAITPNGFCPGDTQMVHSPTSCRRIQPRCSGFTTTVWEPLGSTCLPGSPPPISFTTNLTLAWNRTRSAFRAERTKFRS